MKQLERCDSLQVAYDSKSIELDKLVETNLSIFGKLETETLKRENTQKQLDKLQKNILKESKKGNNGFLYGIGGIIVGMIAVLSIN
jgi:hypothetical protein